MCVFKQQLMGLITIWIDLCFNFMDDITQLSPDGIIGMKHFQRTLDTKKISQCNPFSTVIIFVLALDIGTEAQLHSAKVSFDIYLTQWKSIDFRRHWLNSPTTFYSFHTFSYGISHTPRWSLHCTSLLLFWSQPLLRIYFSPSIYFFLPFQAICRCYLVPSLVTYWNRWN